MIVKSVISSLSIETSAKTFSSFAARQQRAPIEEPQRLLWLMTASPRCPRLIQNLKSKILITYATGRWYLQFSLGQWRVVSPLFLLNLSNRIGEPQLGQGSATGFPQDVNLHSG
jgi:hypothetical protein